jgi:hypothetical protein
MLRLVGRVWVQCIDLAPERVMGCMRMTVILGVVHPILFVPVLVLAGKTSFHVGSGMRFVVVRGWVLCVSWHDR